MKIATLNTNITTTTIETDCAKIGFKYTFGLGAIYTDTLAKSKWDLLSNLIDITLVSGNGNKSLTYKMRLNALAELSAQDKSNVVIQPAYGIANFATAYFQTDISTAGNINISPNQLNIEVSSIKPDEFLDIYAISIPTQSGYLQTFEQVALKSSAPKQIDLSNAISVGVNDSITKIDMLFSDGSSVTFDYDEFKIMQTELNEQTLNVNGLAYVFTKNMSVPVVGVSSAKFYASEDTTIYINRII